MDLRKDNMLIGVEELAPSLLPYVHLAYCSPTSLFCGNKTIEPSEGVQQGDPLGTLLFCLTIYHQSIQLGPEFRVFHLHDGLLGSKVEEINHDLRFIELTADELCFYLNLAKSEVICNDDSTLAEFLLAIPGF